MADLTEPPVRLDFRVLGPTRVCGGASDIAIGGQKPRAVLAALILARGRVVSVGSLGEAVWGLDQPAALTSSLQVLVSNLRKKLRAGGADATVLRTAPPGYRLDLEANQCDVARFEAAHAAGQRAAAAGDPVGAAALFRQALAEWDGPALADLQELRFAAEAATALDEERWTCLMARIDADLAAGRATAVTGELVALTAGQPLREPLWAQLIAALYLSGRQADALEACRRIRAALASQLGIDPSPALTALEQKVLRQEDLGLQAAIGPAPVAQAMSVTVVETLAPQGDGWLRLWDGRRIRVGARRVRIGRMIDNDIEIDDPKVSRYHAEIAAGRAGLVVNDTSSTNGVLVNGLRISGETVLCPGDKIQIGPAVMVCESA